MPVLKIRKEDGTWQEVWGGLTDTPIGGITEQVQADWNEADTTSPAYIKNKPDISGNTDVYWDDIHNKPFGETTELVDLLPTTTFDEFTLDSSFGVYAQGVASSYELVLGETYKVIWDGVEYECVAQDASALWSGMVDGVVVAMGNGSAFGMTGNDEPFIVAVMPTGYTIYVALNDTESGGSHTVSISKKSTVIKTIDPKYLPTDIGGGSGGSVENPLPEIDESGSDNGKVLTVNGTEVEWKAPALPEVSAADAGKFLRVSATGAWVAETIPNAEGASF